MKKKKPLTDEQLQLKNRVDEIVTKHEVEEKARKSRDAANRYARTPDGLLSRIEALTKRVTALENGMPQVKVKFGPGGFLPVRQTYGSSGYDLCSREAKLLSPGDTETVATGVFLDIPKGYEVQIRSRSGLAAKHQIHVLNSPATIDSDFRGELQVILHNAQEPRLEYRVETSFSDRFYIDTYDHAEPFKIEPGDRIAQLVFMKIETPEFAIVDQLTDTQRGSGGLGSTGV